MNTDIVRLALDCLTKSKEKAEIMLQEKTKLNDEYQKVEVETNQLCEELFAKSALIERLKAKYGKKIISFFIVA